jgi:two-component system, cell cycle sensor histidine kinase and response regulator CckA
MPGWDSALPPRAAKSLGWWAIGVAAAFAALALTGWLLDVDGLKSVLPRATPMRVITILCLLASAAALACLHSDPCRGWRGHASRAAGSLVSGVGLLTVASYLVEAATGRPWSASFLPVADLFLAPPTRMAVITALLFLVFGLVVLLLGIGTRRASEAAHVALLPMALMSYVVITGYVFHVQAFYEWMRLGVALNTGLAFCALCLAGFCVRPGTRVMQVFAGEESGAAMARRLLPGLLLLPLVIGWLRIGGERAGLFESDLGVALVAVTYAVSFLVLVWWGASAVNRTDRRRREFEEALRENERRWATTLASIGDGVVATDAAGAVTFLNPTAEELTGYAQAEAAGRPVTEVFRIINEHTRAEVESPVTRVLREGTVVGLANHTLLVRKDGVELPIDDSGAPIRDARGEMAGVVLVFRDVSERRRTETALRESERRLAGVLESMPDAFVSFDADLRYTYVNANAERLQDARGEELLGQDVRVVYPDAESYKTISQYERALREQQPVTSTTYHAGFDRWVEIRAFPTPDGVSVFFKDVSAQVKGEQALRESEARFRLALRNAPVSVAVQDRDLRYTWCYNQRSASPDQIIGHTDTELFTAEEAAHVTAIKRRVLEEGLEHREGMWLDRPTGRMYLDICWEPVRDEAGDVIGVASATIDLTPIKLAEEALERLQFVLSEAQRIAHVGSFEYVADTQTTVWSEEECRIYGLAAGCPSPSYQVMLERFIHPHDAGLLRETFTAAMQSGSMYELEHRIVRPDGTVRVVHDRAHPYFDEQGRLVRYVGATLDITDRKQAEEELRQANARLEMAQRAAGAGVWDWDVSTGDLEWSPELFRLFGLDSAKAGASFAAWEAALHPEDVGNARARIEYALREHTLLDSEYRVVHPDGAVRWISALGQGSYDAHGQPVRMAGICVDITARKQAEQALLEAERARAALAQTLTSEIAHRTKNNLAIVAGLLQLQLESDAAPDAHADLIRDAVTRIMSFAALHEQMYQRHSGGVELVDALRRIADVGRQALSAGEIDISVEGDSAEYPASAATNLCVIANELVTNAIKHGSTPGGRGQVEVRVSRDQGRLVLSVWNAHNPVAEDFDVRRGGRTGLGLVRSIMEDQYGGSFRLLPDRGGTLAVITLDEDRLLKP